MQEHYQGRPDRQLQVNRVHLFSTNLRFIFFWGTASIVLGSTSTQSKVLEAFTQTGKGMVNYLYSNHQSCEANVTKQAQISNHLNYGMPINVLVTLLGQEKLVKLVNRKPFYYTQQVLLSGMMYVIIMLTACMYPPTPKLCRRYGIALVSMDHASQSGLFTFESEGWVVIMTVLKTTSRLTKRSCSNYKTAKH